MSKKIAIELTVRYPVDVVWQALTLPEAVSQWCMETDIKTTVGARFQFRGSPNKFWRGYVDCQILKINPPHLLTFSFQSTDKEDSTVKTYVLTEQNDGTRIQVTHDGFNSTHGMFSGLFVRCILSIGMKKELFKWLPQVLENGMNGNFSKKIKR